MISRDSGSAVHPHQLHPQVSSAHLQQEAGKPTDSGPCSSSTRFRDETSLVSSTSQTSPPETSPHLSAGGAGADRCGGAGWCAPSSLTHASHPSMPPADPGRSSNHVADTSLMLQEQQHSNNAGLASMQLPSTQHAAVRAAAASATPADAAQHEQQAVNPAASHVSKHRPQQSDSEDDSWSPQQQLQPSSADADQEGVTAGAAGVSVDGSSDDDMMAAAAYDDLDDDADADEAAWDPHMPPPVYCTNCTARLYVSDRCSDCGHSNEHDSELLTCSAVSADTAAAAPAGECPLIIWDESMLLHEEGKHEPHPERPDRLRAVMAQLSSNGLTGLCQRVPARMATKQELLRVHTQDHLHRLQLFCSGQVPPSAIPSDTYINQHTLQCAALAAGSAAEVAVRVWQGEGPCGAAIIRPPGHHAESNTAMGFCFFNNAAVAARAVQDAGAERVLILDWDVHHGNGTQHIFEHDDSVMYMSLHRYDRGAFYPGTGGVSEVGLGKGEGFNVNVPWDTDGVSDADYMAAMQQVLVPIAREFAPDVILISAGFDAAAGDPIGGCNLTPECFAAMTAALMPIAPTVMLLEGGYNLRSTALSTEACLRVLLGEQAPELQHGSPSPYAWFSIQAARKAHSKYWHCLQGGLPTLQLPAGWRFAAAAAAAGGGEQQPGGEGGDSDDLELQYDDEYEEADYESKESEGQGDDDWDEGEAEGEWGDEEGGVEETGSPEEEGADAAVPMRHHHHHQQQQRSQGVRGVDAGFQALRVGSKRSLAGLEGGGGDDAGGGVDAGGRVRFAAGASPAAAGLPPHLQQQQRQPAASSNAAAARPLLPTSSSVSSGSVGGSSGGGSVRRQGGAARVQVSRKQLMLRAIHHRAMQLFLKKQRKLAAAARQQQKHPPPQQQQQ